MRSASVLFTVFTALCCSVAVAQKHQPNEKYIVTTYDDTVYCDEIKLNSLNVTCKTKAGKKDILNENVRRIYMPVETSDWQDFFSEYAKGGKKSVYPYSPGQVKEAVTSNVYPRFYDLKPIDEERDYWKRELFEILVQNNGYKLCKLKGGQPTSGTPSFAGGSGINSKTSDKYIIFEEYAASGTVLNKGNYREALSKLVKGCPAAENALMDKGVDHLQNVPAFLTLFAKCN